MKIIVGRTSDRPDATVPADQLRLPAIEALSAPVNTRRVSLNEDAYVAKDGPAPRRSKGRSPVVSERSMPPARGLG